MSIPSTCSGDDCENDRLKNYYTCEPCLIKKGGRKKPLPACVTPECAGDQTRESDQCRRCVAGKGPWQP